jgi:uncharacterized protein (TIGR03437 family)
MGFLAPRLRLCYALGQIYISAGCVQPVRGFLQAVQVRGEISPMERLSRREFLQAFSVAVACAATHSFGQSSAILRLPYVQKVGGAEATVLWTTPQAGSGAVEFWSDSQIPRRALAAATVSQPWDTGMAAPFYCHEAVLDELEPGRYYTYRVLLEGQPLDGGVRSFRTPGPGAFEFLALGDSGTGSFEQAQIAQRMLQHPAQLVIHTGDLAYPTGTYTSFENNYFGAYRDLMAAAPFFPCPGNHEYYEQRAAPYFSVHAFPQQAANASEHGRYYSFDWGNAHFVSLDSNDALRDAVDGRGEMLSWLDRDLQGASKFWRIVFIHHPGYSVGKHRDEPEAQLIRRHVAPILDKYSVPLMLNGHEHSYQRTMPIRAGSIARPGEGTVYLTTGGGGAELQPIVASADHMEVAVSEHHYLSCSVDGGTLRIKALRPDGTELDSFAASPPPVFAAAGVVNAAALTPQLASGGLAFITGFQLAVDDVAQQQFPLPTQAAGTTVLIDNTPAPILNASANKITVQIPFEIRGGATLTVQTPNGAASLRVTIDDVAPALFENAIFSEDGDQISADRPAKPGESLNVYLTGLGKPAARVATGEAAAAAPAMASVQVVLEAVQARPRRTRGRDRGLSGARGFALPTPARNRLQPDYAGLAPGVAGINCVKFRVPQQCGEGRFSLRVVANGVESNTVALPVAPEASTTNSRGLSAA